MPRTIGRTTALAALAAALAGCATTDPRGAFEATAASLADRHPGELAFRPDAAAEARIAARRDAFLAAPRDALGAAELALLGNPFLRARLEELGLAQADLSLANPVAGGLAQTRAFSILMWVVVDAFVANAGVVNLRAIDGDSGFALDLPAADNDTLVFEANTSGNTTYATVAVPDVNEGVGHDIGLVWNAASHTLRGWHHDGSNVNAAAGGTVMTLDGDESFHIGRNPDTGTQFQGRIDELRYYDAALTNAQIAAVFAGTLVYVQGFENGDFGSWVVTQ